MSEKISITTPTELLNALNLLYGNTKNSKQPEKYHYKIYVRKSTSDEEKQIRSLADQISDCEEYANDNDLILVGKPIQESESAKEPDTRPKFREMLNDIKAEKYDGILAWHPDRLARNMKDAGEIIDLLDKGVIKDLKFKSFTFDNTTSGKMLLGITFVLSKQYSDHLSDSVFRGNARSILEGKYINKPKHGYIKDSDQFLRPDANNFNIIKEVFKMRLSGKTLNEIAVHVNKQGYTRYRKKKGKRLPFNMTKQTIDKIIRDPVYTGILMYGKADIVNLMELYDFTEMVTVKEFMQINKFSRREQMIKLAKSYRKEEGVKANLMRQMVVCDNCGETMTSSVTNKKTKTGIRRYFYYRCDTDGCSFCGKSVRAKVIIEYIYNFLSQKPFSDQLTYKHYEQEMKEVSIERIKQAKSSFFSLQAHKRKSEAKIVRIKNMLTSDEEDSIKQEYKGDLKKVRDDIKNTDNNIEEVQKVIKKGKASILTYTEFLELIENMPLILRKTKNMSELDYIVRKMFLNFTIQNKKVIESTLNTPFSALCSVDVSDCGR